MLSGSAGENTEPPHPGYTAGRWHAILRLEEVAAVVQKRLVLVADGEIDVAAALCRKIEIIVVGAAIAGAAGNRVGIDRANGPRVVGDHGVRAVPGAHRHRGEVENGPGFQRERDPGDSRAGLNGARGANRRHHYFVRCPGILATSPRRHCLKRVAGRDRMPEERNRATAVGRRRPRGARDQAPRYQDRVAQHSIELGGRGGAGGDSPRRGQPLGDRGPQGRHASGQRGRGVEAPSREGRA